jgi:hypothetical protein
LFRYDDGRIVAPEIDMDDETQKELAAARAEIRGAEEAIKQEIRQEAEATRRHFDMVSESLRDDIRIIAEGLIVLDAKVEAMRDAG